MDLRSELETCADLQVELTRDWHTDLGAGPSDLVGLSALVMENHRRNFNLWHEEDEARRDDLGAEHVYRAKRAIDQLNQQRNDFIEKIDKFLVQELSPSREVPSNSETPGMILDRLSILALKAYHMAEQTEREDVDAAHIERCRQRKAVIDQQRGDLLKALLELVVEVQAGSRSFNVYFQFKMYNDPKLNPKLYGAGSDASA
jgi:hypothetical protein